MLNKLIRPAIERYQAIGYHLETPRMSRLLLLYWSACWLLTGDLCCYPALPYTSAHRLWAVGCVLRTAAVFYVRAFFYLYVAAYMIVNMIAVTTKHTELKLFRLSSPVFRSVFGNFVFL